MLLKELPVCAKTQREEKKLLNLLKKAGLTIRTLWLLSFLPYSNSGHGFDLKHLNFKNLPG